MSGPEAPAGPGTLAWPSRARHVVALALCSTVICSMPVLLLGAFAVELRREFGFGVVALGGAVATFRSSGVIFAPALGRLADRLGPWRAMLSAGLVAGTASLAIAVGAVDLMTLCIFLAVGGAASTLGDAGANLALTRGVAQSRQGVAFGLKQAAVPVGSLVGGAAVPLVALTIGWRWAFGGIAFGALVLALVLGWRPAASVNRAPLRPGRLDHHRALMTLSAGFLLSNMAGASLITFAVDAAWTAGVSLEHAGWMLAAGSLGSIVVRVAAGVRADRRGNAHLRAVAVLILLGVVGLLMIATMSPALVGLGMVISMAFGWGFNGLFWFAVIRLYPSAPGRATGFVMPGGLLGGIAGPLLFGVVVAASGYRTAWLLAAFWAVGGAIVISRGRAQIRRASSSEPGIGKLHPCGRRSTVSAEQGKRSRSVDI